MNTKNLSQSHSAIQKFAIGLSIVLVVSNFAWAIYTVQLASTPPEWSYVATDLGVLKARLSPESIREEPEMVSHVRSFCSKMYSHNEENYTSQINAALELISSNPGQRIIMDFEQAALYNSYIELSGKTKFIEDTIVVDSEAKKGVIYGRVQTTAFVPEKRTIESPLAARFELSLWNRHEKNPHGLLISTWEKIPYNP